MQGTVRYGDSDDFQVVQPIDHIADASFVATLEFAFGPRFGYALAIILRKPFEILDTVEPRLPPCTVVNFVT